MCSIENKLKQRHLREIKLKRLSLISLKEVKIIGSNRDILDNLRLQILKRIYVNENRDPKC